MQSLEVERQSSIPPLAWLGDFRRTARLICGADVETGDGYAVEGCWDAPFEGAGFAEAPNFFGSGLVWRDDTPTFASSTHLFDPLYVLLDDGGPVVSNSLAFIAEYANLSFDPRGNFMEPLVAVIEGLRAYPRKITSFGSRTLHRVACANIRIRGGAIEETAKTIHPPFADFAGYSSYVANSLDRLLANAADTRRRCGYRPLTAVSGGYDSNACAALARDAGATDTVTVVTSRDGVDDGGAHIAAALGIGCREHARPERAVAFAEAEFLATGAGTGGEFVFAPFEPSLGHRVFITGFHGDGVWNRERPGSADLVRPDDGGCSLQEFRLRVGFLHIPMPFIGATKPIDIWQISNSPDMAPWSIGGGYDRPIPRRILEERGVPRKAFGQRKVAAAAAFAWDPQLLHPSSLDSFRAFVADHGLTFRLRFDRALFRVGWWLEGRLAAATHFDSRELGGRLGLGGAWWLRGVRRWTARFHNSTTLYGNLLFVWAMGLTRARYRRSRDLTDTTAASNTRLGLPAPAEC